MNATDTPGIEAVVFDLDGLMLNTEDVFALSGKELLGRRGLEMTEEIHFAMLGRRPNEAFQAMKDLTGINDSIDTLKQETTELFRHFAEDHLDKMPGLNEVLSVIGAQNLPTAVATSSPRDYLSDMLSRFDLHSHFQFTLAAEDVTHGKPNPEIYLTAANRLNVAPARMLVLEDSQAGVTAAASASAFAVAVPNEHTQRGDFSMASLQVSSLHAPELMTILRG